LDGRSLPANANPDIALSRALRELREEAGLTQEEVANRAGLHYTSLRDIESGRADPMWGTVRRLAAALEVEAIEVIRLADEIRAE